MKRAKLVGCVMGSLPGFAIGEATIGQNFSGLSQASSGLSTNLNAAVAGAIGPNEYAEFVNGGIATYNRNTGAQLQSMSSTNFWTNAGVSSSILSSGARSPRILYDAAVNRWYAVQVTSEASNNHLLLAVSQSDSASLSSGNWKAISVATSISGSSYHFGESPSLGFDAGNVYVTTNNQFGAVGSPDYSASIFSFPKSSLTSAVGPTTSGSHIVYGTSGNAETWGFQPQAVVTSNTNSTGQHFIAISYTTFGVINHFIVNGSTVSSVDELTVGPTNFPSSPRQPDGTGYPSPNNGIDPFDDRISNNVYQVGNLIYLAHAIGLPADETEATQSAIRWDVLKVTASGMQLFQEGTIQDPKFDFFQPSIAANASGDVVIGFNRSGPASGSGEINSFFDVGHTAADGTLTFDDPQRASLSPVGNYHAYKTPDPWSQTSSITVDPTDNSIFWLANEVPISSSTWGTQITEVETNTSTVPEPASLALFAPAILWITRRQRSRRA